MKEDLSLYKGRLADYLAAKGIRPQNNGNYHCLSPDHLDSDPSMTFYDNGGNNEVNCNSCDFKGDIFDCAGVLIGEPGKDNFKAQLADIKNVLGGFKQASIKKKARVSAAKPVPLTYDEAKKVYTDEAVLDLGNAILNTDKKKKKISKSSSDYKHLEIARLDPYFDENEKIDIMAVRFNWRQGEKTGKDVVTFYWNGKRLLSRNYPVLLFNRHKVTKSQLSKVLFHEGEKCCKIGEECLNEFIHVTWNGGSKKWKNIQGLEILKDFEIFLLPDDDKPGHDAMDHLQDRLFNEFGIQSYIVDSFERAREVKPKGADIEEILQVYSIEEIIEQIYRSRENDRKTRETIDCDSRTPTEADHENVGNQGVSDDSTSGEYFHGDNYPFQILGIGDDNKAYFLEYTGRLINHDLPSLTEKKLVDLAGLQFWKNQCSGHPDKKQWLELIDELMYASKQVDFDIDHLRGRGAWRTKKGEISYFDGRELIGTPDPSWTFVRRPRRKIGIGHKETGFETRSEIYNTCKLFTFCEICDVVRALSWAALAPFGGALKWRPAVLITSRSGAGKSTILDSTTNVISGSEFFSGNETTEPGIREVLGLDSFPVTIDEAEPGVEKRDQERFARIISGIRTATTDNSPKTAKGTGGHGAMIYRMRSMFLLAAINTAFGNVADDNRIIRVNLTPKNNFETFTEALKKINNLLSNENVLGIRSFVWNRLPKIIKTGQKLEYIITKMSGASARFAAGESILLSCFMHVWEDWDAGSLDNESFLEDYVGTFYNGQVREEERDETHEIVERILDEPIMVDDLKERHSVREVLIFMKMFEDRQAGKYLGDSSITYQYYEWYKKAVEMCGITLHSPTGEMFIANSHHIISRITGLGRGYHRMLMRHKNLISHNGLKNPSYKIDSATKRGVVIGKCLNYEE